MKIRANFATIFSSSVLFSNKLGDTLELDGKPSTVSNLSLGINWENAQFDNEPDGKTRIEADEFTAIVDEVIV